MTKYVFLFTDTYIHYVLYVLWIRIRIDHIHLGFRARIRIGNMDPNPGAWIIDQNMWKLNFLTLNSDQDPDPHSSALVCLPGSGSALRKAVSGSVLKLMRIHNIAYFYRAVFFCAKYFHNKPENMFARKKYLCLKGINKASQCFDQALFFSF